MKILDVGEVACCDGVVTGAVLTGTIEEVQAIGRIMASHNVMVMEVAERDELRAQMARHQKLLEEAVGIHDALVAERDTLQAKLDACLADQAVLLQAAEKVVEGEWDMDGATEALANLLMRFGVHP